MPDLFLLYFIKFVIFVRRIWNFDTSFLINSLNYIYIFTVIGSANAANSAKCMNGFFLIIARMQKIKWNTTDVFNIFAIFIIITVVRETYNQNHIFGERFLEYLICVITYKYIHTFVCEHVSHIHIYVYTSILTSIVRKAPIPYVVVSGLDRTTIKLLRLIQYKLHYVQVLTKYIIIYVRLVLGTVM